jgi:4-hydroxy-tetrahydrodipicolinate reductase
MEPLRVVQIGVGPIGQEVCRLVLERMQLRLVGAVDIAHGLVGHPLSEVLGVSEDCGITVAEDAEAVLRETDPDVVVHTTTSRLPDVVRQIEVAAMHGANVVSSTEELLFPRLTRPGEAAELEVVALDNNVAILGTGVNPGFVLDTLALISTSVCRRIDRIEGRRVVDAATRRQPLQRKVGAGMPVDEFGKLAAEEKIGHSGLRESAGLICQGLGWRWDEIDQKTEPVIAECAMKTDFFQIEAGQVAGIRNTAWAVVDGAKKIQLELIMAVGAADPIDQIKVFGEPDLTLQIPGGTPGDLATAAILVNAVPSIADAPPGLLTMLDMPILHCQRDVPLRMGR